MELLGVDGSEDAREKEPSQGSSVLSGTVEANGNASAAPLKPLG